MRPRHRRSSARRSPSRRAAALRSASPSFRRGWAAAPRRRRARRLPRATAPGGSAPGRARRRAAQGSRAAPEARGVASSGTRRTSAVARASSCPARSTPPPPCPRYLQIGAYLSALRAHARAILLPPLARNPPLARALARTCAAQPALPRHDEWSFGSASSRSVLLFPFIFDRLFFDSLGVGAGLAPPPAAPPSPAMSAGVAGDRSQADGDDTDSAAAPSADDTATSDGPKALHDGAAA